MQRLSLLNSHLTDSPPTLSSNPSVWVMTNFQPTYTLTKQGTLKGKTVFITGASRGIGLAIGLRAAKDGANVVIAAKTVTPHP